MIELAEKYKDFDPHPAVKRSFERMIKALPPETLRGIKFVVLTDTSVFNRKQRRVKTSSRNKKVSLSHSLGWYRPGLHGEPAEIEIVVDSILNGYPRWLLKSHFVTDIIFGEVFFHEIGHHIHATQKPEHGNKEDVADKWQSKLSRQYFWRKYWYCMSLLYPFRRIIKLLSKKNQ